MVLNLALKIWAEQLIAILLSSSRDLEIDFFGFDGIILCRALTDSFVKCPSAPISVVAKSAV